MRLKLAGLILGALAVVAGGTYFFTRGAASSEPQRAAAAEGRTLYDYTVKDAKGRDVSLADYRGKVVMLVNVASKCGYTPQYDGLQKLYERYRDRGFVVLGFPANNFGGQEPGTDEQIQDFCRLNYGVNFPVFAKISVKGDDKHPLYQHLTDEATNPGFAGEVKWNFNKFLVGKDGRVVARFESADKPESEKVTQAVESALAGS
ncbi:MAG TPA: glutathione peroxidase [Pyrinomonadaceae bacterium]|nr:glutathione peroxidase [Pyrinomonadaceae bacterium]